MDERKNAPLEETEAKAPEMNRAYMDRLFCSTKERVSYVSFKALGELKLDGNDIGSSLWLNKIYGVLPTKYADAMAVLGIYDMINDPVSAAIIDNMRTRWGKFKPFQYLSLLPGVLMGIFGCLLPVIANSFAMDAAARLVMLMIFNYANETIGAFFGGGGYIENVFTPNPNERTSLLVSAKFVKDLISKFPGQLLSILYDLINNGILKTTMTSVFITTKTVVWIITIVPTIFWYLTSKERVPQSEKPPHPVKGVLSVFRNRPLLISLFTDLIGGIDVGTDEALYRNDVLKFNTIGMVAGIPGMPLSYASYAFVPKFRAKFSTKTLWFFQSGSIIFSEALFFFVGMIGGKENGLYLKKLPMALAFGAGNMVEMVFYATKGIINSEINYEVLDYCEWKNGFRVEATIGMMKGYFYKVKDIVLKLINSRLLEIWAGYKIGEDAIQTAETKWRIFLLAHGPHLIFDVLGLIPMIFYNIDKPMREKMYLDLERTRAARAAMATDGETEQTQKES